MTTAAAPIGPQTLAQLQAEGRLPLAEAMKYSMVLAESLRKVHDSGCAHGAVSPAVIVLSDGRVGLLPATLPSEATPYTAPEVLEGQVPDARSDVFSFGAVVYEMLTGRRAFEGESPSALAAAIVDTEPPSSGSLAVDRLLAGCLAKDPEVRLQRMQKVLLELKLLTMAWRRAESPVPLAEKVEAALQAQMQQLESRTVAEMRDQQTWMAEIERAAGNSLAELQQGIVAISNQLSEVAAHACSTDELDAAAERIQGRTNEMIGAIAPRLGTIEQSVASVVERVVGLERGIETLRRDAAALRQNLAATLQDLEPRLKGQGSAIESVRRAMAQTDDLVERVVEALEVLQSSVIEHAQELTAAA